MDSIPITRRFYQWRGIKTAEIIRIDAKSKIFIFFFPSNQTRNNKDVDGDIGTPMVFFHSDLLLEEAELAWYVYVSIDFHPSPFQITESLSCQSHQIKRWQTHPFPKQPNHVSFRFDSSITIDGWMDGQGRYIGPPIVALHHHRFKYNFTWCHQH